MFRCRLQAVVGAAALGVVVHIAPSYLAAGAGSSTVQSIYSRQHRFVPCKMRPACATVSMQPAKLTCDALLQLQELSQSVGKRLSAAEPRSVEHLCLSKCILTLLHDSEAVLTRYNRISRYSSQRYQPVHTNSPVSIQQRLHSQSQLSSSQMTSDSSLHTSMATPELASNCPTA